MTTVRNALLAGAAVLLLAGSVGYAEADSPTPTHVLTVRLPGGGIEQIHYSGNVAPQIVLLPDGDALPVALAPSTGFWVSPFATLDRIAAQMDRETASMLQQAEMLAAQPFPGPDQLVPLGFGRMPAGAQGYSFVATFSGNGVCTRSVTITSQGDNARPRVVSDTSGNCGAQPAAAQSDVVAPAHLPPGTVQAKAEQAQAAHPIYAGLIHDVGAWQR